MKEKEKKKKVRVFIHPASPVFCLRLNSVTVCSFYSGLPGFLGSGCGVESALREFPLHCVCNCTGVGVTMGVRINVHFTRWWLLQRCWSP